MPKFKVGDRVKLVSMVPRFGFGPYVKTGAIGIVTHVAVTTQDRPEIYVNFPKHSEWQGMHSEFILEPKTATTTKKPKETKTMNTKKPDTSHGKPTAKGMKAALKPKVAKTTPNPVDTGTKAPEAPYRPTVGDVVKIVKDTCYHMFPIGSVFTIKKDDKSDLPYSPEAKKNPRGNWFKPIDCELITKAADVVKVPKEPTPAKSVKPKYPAPRVQRELIAEAKPLEKCTKAELIVTAEDRATQFHNLSADYCIEGTKLDRALVDLKEAKAKIKELSKALEAAK